MSPCERNWVLRYWGLLSCYSVHYLNELRVKYILFKLFKYEIEIRSTGYAWKDYLIYRNAMWTTVYLCMMVNIRKSNCTFEINAITVTAALFFLTFKLLCKASSKGTTLSSCWSRNYFSINHWLLYPKVPTTVIKWNITFISTYLTSI